MDIRVRETNKGWLAEVWASEVIPGWDFDEPYPEDVYTSINTWCIETFGYHARTSYHIFEFKNKQDLDWFLLRWTGE